MKYTKPKLKYLTDISRNVCVSGSAASFIASCTTGPFIFINSCTNGNGAAITCNNGLAAVIGCSTGSSLGLGCATGFSVI